MEKNKSSQHAAKEEYKRKLEEAEGEVNMMVADADGEYLKAKIEADVYLEQQQLLARAFWPKASRKQMGSGKRITPWPARAAK